MDRDDAAFQRFEISRNDSLQRQHYVCTDHQRVDPRMRIGGVRALAFNDDAKAIG